VALAHSRCGKSRRRRQAPGLTCGTGAQINFTSGAVPLAGTLFKPEIFANVSLPQMLAALKDTLAGQPFPHQIPSYLQGATLEALANQRRNNVRTFNEYRVTLGYAVGGSLVGNCAR
jgi:hypothetical protein